MTATSSADMSMGQVYIQSDGNAFFDESMDKNVFMFNDTEIIPYISSIPQYADEFWFDPVEFCQIIAIGNSKQAVNQHVEPANIKSCAELKPFPVCGSSRKKLPWQKKMVNEDGIIDILCGSKKPMAKTFRKFVCKMLKQLRKNGEIKLKHKLQTLEGENEKLNDDISRMEGQISELQYDVEGKTDMLASVQDTMNNLKESVTQTLIETDQQRQQMEQQMEQQRQQMEQQMEQQRQQMELQMQQQRQQQRQQMEQQRQLQRQQMEIRRQRCITQANQIAQLQQDISEALKDRAEKPISTSQDCEFTLCRIICDDDDIPEDYLQYQMIRGQRRHQTNRKIHELKQIYGANNVSVLYRKRTANAITFSQKFREELSYHVDYENTASCGFGTYHFDDQSLIEIAQNIEQNLKTINGTQYI